VIKLVIPTNIKNQFCSNGTLTFEIFGINWWLKNKIILW
jgi:hypothetical protein